MNVLPVPPDFVPTVQGHSSGHLNIERLLIKKALGLSDGGFLLQDQGGTILHANQALCDMFGYAEEEIVQCGSRRLFSPRSLSIIQKKILPESMGLGIGKGEVEGLKKGGGLFPLLVSIFTVRDEEDHIQGQVFLCRDLSKEREISCRRIQSDKLAAMGGMLAEVAHELNNPLTSVVGFSQLLMRKRVNADIKKQLKKIASEAIRTSKIVQNLLSFIRFHRPEKTLVGVNGVIQNVLELKSRHLRVDNIRIIRKLASDDALPKVDGDYQKLLEVFLNLINNAHQAMALDRGKGTLTIQTESVEHTVVIRISDTGPGIPKEVQTKLFHPFFTTKPEGNGLGLPISRNTIKEHGGEIFVENSKRRGTTFVIRLPIGPDQSAKPIDAVAQAPARAAQLRILVLDDEEMILDLYYHFLTQLGHDPHLFKSGDEALEVLDRPSTERGYDLIITDIKIPKMNGREFYKRIEKDHPQLKDRIIFVTGDALSDTTSRFVKERCLSVLYKPFVLNQLEQAIQPVLQKPNVRIQEESP